MKVAIKKIIARFAASLLPVKVMRNKKFFCLWESKGYHVTPVHFYQPVPDTRELNEDLWSKHSDLVGININEEGQIICFPNSLQDLRKSMTNSLIIMHRCHISSI